MQARPGCSTTWRVARALIVASAVVAILVPMAQAIGTNAPPQGIFLDDGVTAIGVRDDGTNSAWFDNSTIGGQPWLVSANCGFALPTTSAHKEGQVTLTLRYRATDAEAMDCDNEGTGFGIGYKDASGPVGSKWKANDMSYSGPKTYDPLQVGPGPAEATTTTHIGALTMTQHFAPHGTHPSVFNDTITIRNDGAGLVQDVRYRHALSFGPSVNSQTNDCVTMTIATLPPGSPSPPALLSSNAIPLMVPDLNPWVPWKLSAASAGPPATKGLYDYGGIDGGSGWDILFGNLSVGQEKRFTMFLGAEGSKPDAMATLAAIGADVYAMSVTPATGNGVQCSPDKGMDDQPAFFVAFNNLTKTLPAVNLDFKVTRPILCSDHAVLFDETLATVAWGKILTRTYDFGDGTSAPGPKATHTFPTPGASYTVRYTVTDDSGQTTTTTHQVVAPDGDCPPTLDPIPDQVVKVGALLQVACFVAYDIDDTDAELSWTVNGRPSGANVDANHCMTFTPEAYQVGYHLVTVKVCDRHACAQQEFWIDVWQDPPGPRPDSCLDGDYDGVCDSADDCPGVADHGQRDDDGNGRGDACQPVRASPAVQPPRPPAGALPDVDRDGVADPADNCPLRANRGQEDLDADLFGDVCDDDIDGDGMPNRAAQAEAFLDNCPWTPNPDQADRDGDGQGDACGPIVSSPSSIGPGSTTARDIPKEPFPWVWMVWGALLGAATAGLLASRRARPAFVLLFSRLVSGDLLQHPIRARLVDEVERNPGIHFRALMRATGKSRGVVGHHLAVLERAHVVHRREWQGMQGFYAQSGAEAKDAHPALRTKGARELLAAVCAEPGLRAAELARRTGRSRGAVAHHLRRLAGAKLVELRGEPPQVHPVAPAAAPDR